MHALVIGGSGRCGKLVIDELLRRGHKVAALARNPVALGDPRPGLTIIKGTPTSLTDVRRSFTPLPDIILVTLSAPRASDSPFAPPVSPPDLMASCNENIITAMKEFGVRKILILQALGVGVSWGNMHCLLQLLMGKSNMRFQYDDHNAVERVVRESGMDYVFVRPARLIEDETGVEGDKVKVWPENGGKVPLMASARRTGVARFMVDAAERNEWDNQAPVITD
ncbi:uncharacterized protein BDV17DRAFT_259347 [Aspergillus undulatus]|uniref:uncharacterized protein n=1 Tax=Aspergillus undulatus TaxID=1810928 RepID=UPI003CCE51FC